MRPEERRAGRSSRYRAALRSRVFSFRYAFAGIRFALSQPNFRLQLGIALVVLIAAAILRVQPGEWLALILVSLAVLLMEMLNTVVEALVDLASPEYHPLAKIAKDGAAGAVLVSSLAAVIVGVYVFIPRLVHLISR